MGSPWEPLKFAFSWQALTRLPSEEGTEAKAAATTNLMVWWRSVIACEGPFLLVIMNEATDPFSL